MLDYLTDVLDDMYIAREMTMTCLGYYDKLACIDVDVGSTALFSVVQ